MALAARFLWLPCTALVVGALASPALAQFSMEGNGTTNVAERYNKAKKGANLTEWAQRLNDEDPARRLEAVKSMGESGDVKATDYLVQAVNDSDPRVQAKAVEILGTLRAADATPPLVQKLFTVGTSEPLRHRILMALGKIGDARASRPILQFVEQDSDIDIRGAGLFALGEIADPAVRDDLKRAMEIEDDPRLRQVANDALFKISLRQSAPKPRDPSEFPTALDAALSTDR